ncbi:EF-hand domain-containing protein [Nafulsella turpanensis]|uniref:EF-hand domain-containing protein n=1 Tax=Nafulsella turpanensis TaxID=1265690 RepID=UPI00037F3AC7|nr:EF-hand domain-containing protein [Nafulsella turpanensis]
MAKGKCLLLMLSLFSALVTANAQVSNLGADTNFREWDKDRNGRLTHAEFYNGLRQTSLFEHWDRSSDGAIDRQEYFIARAELLKNPGRNLTAEAEPMLANASGPFTPALSPGAAEPYFPELQVFSLEESDLNRNGTIDQTEFITALFRLWDKNVDGHIRAAELKDGRLRRWFY